MLGGRLQLPDQAGLEGRFDPCPRARHRAGALAAIPEEMVDAIDVTGDEALVRDTISAYRRAGVDIPVVFPLTWGAAGQEGLESTLRAAIAPPLDRPSQAP